MITPESLSVKELKEFRENVVDIIDNSYDIVEIVQGKIVIGMIDVELLKRKEVKK